MSTVAWEGLLRSPYSAALLSSESASLEVAKFAKGFIPEDDPMLDPAFFLASVSRVWTPRIVVIRESENIRGLVYFKERKVLGFPTGILYADGSLGTMLIVESRLRQDALRLALDMLLARPKTRGIRLKIPPGGPEGRAIRQVLASRTLDISYGRMREHARLTLPNDYQLFLKNLGSTTRHNFRYYRRRFDAAGHRFEEISSMEELRSAAWQLRAKSRRPATRSALERLLQMVGSATPRWAAGLKNRDGQWMSVAAGCYSNTRAVLFLQLNNDKDFPRSSLSVVLRANLIERFIENSVPEFIFWAGAGRPLAPYCWHAPALVVTMDKPGHAWRLARALASRAARWMPKNLGKDLRFAAGSP